MPTWIEAIGSALPVVMVLALVIWMAIVYHGDSRWVRHKDAYDADGETKWAKKEKVESMSSLLLGQNDKLADHEDRVGRMEERERATLKRIDHNLDGIATGVSDMRDRVIRLETKMEQRRHEDT